MGWRDFDPYAAHEREADELHDEIDRLTAEVERLRGAIRWHRLAAEETVGADTSDPDYYEPFDHALWAALGESLVPDEPTAPRHCGGGHLLAVDHGYDDPGEWWSVCGRCGVEFGPFDSQDEAVAMGVTGLPAPSHPTGEERTDG